MDLMLDARQLARFLDLRPKVIIPSDDLLAELCLEDSTEPPFDTWFFTATDANAAVLRLKEVDADNGPLIVAPNPPAASCVLAALTAPGCNRLEALRTWWAANGPSSAPPVLHCRASDSAATEILSDLLRSTLQEVRATAANATTANAQLYSLRCEGDQTRVVVEALQAEMLRIRLRPQLMTVHLPTTGRVYVPPRDGGVLVQPLPVSAESMAGIDLHFPSNGPVADDAQVWVRLHALDLGRDLGCWRLLAPHLGKGWVRCWLPEVLGVASHNLELRVEWLRGTGPAPAISLASAGDWHEMNARTPNNAGCLSDCLALTAWAGGVPGAPLQPGSTWCTPQNDSVEYSLRREDIGRMKLHVPDVAGKPTDWFPFQQRWDGSFMLHPIAPTATTLQLANGCPTGVDRVTAVVKITSPHPCRELIYGIAASTNDEASQFMDITDLQNDPRFLAFSGWHTIPRDDAPHVIVMDFPEPLRQPAHLLLATRTLPDVDSAWSWADFLEVRLRVRSVQGPQIEVLQQRAA